MAQVKYRLRTKAWVQVMPSVYRVEGAPVSWRQHLEALGYEVIAAAAAGLPRPRKQRAVYAGKRLRRLDLCFDGHEVVVELDGYAHHSGLDSFEADRARNNALTARGFVVLHWTWQALHERPGELLGELVAVLRARSR